MIENVERLVDVKGIGTEFPQELHMVGRICLLVKWRNCTWSLRQQRLPKVVGELTHAVLPALLVSPTASGEEEPPSEVGTPLSLAAVKRCSLGISALPCFCFYSEEWKLRTEWSLGWM